MKTNRCKTHIQARITIGFLRLPFPSEFPTHGNTRLGDGESDATFSTGFQLCATPAALLRNLRAGLGTGA